MATLALISLLGIAAAWLVYPAGIGLVAILRRRRQTAAAQPDAFVSVVLATRESMASIRARVANCLESDHAAAFLEVVIALDRAAEPGEQNALMEGFERVVVARSAGRGKAAALNAGVEAAHGDSIVFADTYQRFDRQTIPRLIARLAEDGVGAVSGNLVLPGGRSPIVRNYWRYERWLRETEARVHSSVGVTGAVYAIRKELWRPLPAGLILDDVYVPMRIVLD
ncbi:MAG: glycosyltransferase, partial [Longimicrobiales bacterium]